MNIRLFWSSLIFSVGGWVMYFIDKRINNPQTDASIIGILVGVLGIFGLVLSITEEIKLKRR